MKVKKLRFTVLFEGEVVDYQTIIEETIGGEISKLSCYYPNWNNEKVIKGHTVVNRMRAYFIPDCDYEIIIKPIRNKSNNDPS